MKRQEKVFLLFLVSVLSLFVFLDSVGQEIWRGFAAGFGLTGFIVLIVSYYKRKNKAIV